MKKVFKKWDDPPFGFVPEQFREYFEKASGTYWNDNKKLWYISGSQQEKSWRKVKKEGVYEEGHVLKAKKFQDEYLAAKQLINDTVGGIGEGFASRTNVYEYLVYGKTQVVCHVGNEVRLIEVGF